jgi:hypothetical protein
VPAFLEEATMPSERDREPDRVSDEEIETVRGEEADATDAGIAAPSGATDTGVMMDAADTGTADIADVAAPSGATDTGMMMDARDTGTVDRTDVGEREDADADESDR